MIGELISTGVTFGTGRESINSQFSGTAEFNNIILEPGANFSGGTGGGAILSGGTDLYDIFSTGLDIDLWSSSTGSNSIVANNGTGNLASGIFSIASGAENKSYGIHASISGGWKNHAFGNRNFIGGGFSNSASTNSSAIIGGQENSVTGSASFIGAGINNSVLGNYSSSIGGVGNVVSGERSIVLGGQNITGTTNDTVYAPNLVVNDNLYTPNPTIPSSSGDTGSVGQISWDSDYIYICVATNTWKRTSIAGW